MSCKVILDFLIILVNQIQQNGIVVNPQFPYQLLIFNDLLEIKMLNLFLFSALVLFLVLVFILFPFALICLLQQFFGLLVLLFLLFLSLLGG